MTLSRDTGEEAARVQVEVYRKMGPSERLRVGLELTRMSRELLAEGISRRHPEYSEDQVKWALIRRWLGPELFARAYPRSPQLEP
jgi:hypothetical protein